MNYFIQQWFTALLVIWLAGACGVARPEPQNNQAQGGIETTAETTDSTGGDDKIILRVATGDSGDGLIPHQQIIDQFEAENPDIVVELESVEGRDYYGRLLTDIAAGNAPDIMQIGDDALPKFVEQSALVPLDPLMSGSYPLERDIYLPELLEPGRWQGQQYLLPKDYSTLAVFYNKKIFDEYGLPYPQTGWTWADFLETAQALTKDVDGDGKIDVWGVQLAAAWTTGFEYWVAAAGGRLISQDGRQIVGFMDSPEVVEAVQFYADLYNKYQVAPLPQDLNTFGGGNNEFDNGQAAMRIFGRWPQAGLLKNAELELGVVGVPQHRTQANILIWGGLGIARGSQHQKAAWRLLRFYVGEQGSRVWKDWALPAVEVIAAEQGLVEDPIEGVWLDELNYLVPRGYTSTPYWERTVDPALRRVLETVIIDPDADVAGTLQQAAREAQVELDAIE